LQRHHHARQRLAGCRSDMSANGRTRVRLWRADARLFGNMSNASSNGSNGSNGSQAI
jgi:hypothetical protein